jgi:tRNA(Ile)-lysidine synthase
MPLDPLIIGRIKYFWEMLPLQRFQDFIRIHGLSTIKAKLLLAVSGGKDSVLMVHLFKLAGYDFAIAHCNFNLRGAESRRDEIFVRNLAVSMDVPFYFTDFDTEAHSASHKVSTQMAARDLRYNWFEKIRQEGCYDFTALAHHQNDVVETVLLNLVRGTGIAGLHGILPKRGFLIRPLLFLTRQEIDNLITFHKIEYVEDSSNAKDNYARNKLRLHVIPQLKLINKSLEQTFQQNVRRFAETEVVLQQQVAQLRSKIVKVNNGEGSFFTAKIAIEDVKSLLPQRLLLFELLQVYGFSEPVVDDIIRDLDHQSGTSFYSETHRLTINRNDLMITLILEQPVSLKQIEKEEELVEFNEYQIFIKESTLIEFAPGENQAYVDAELLIYPLMIRTRQDGDRFIPLGMHTFKKLSNYYVDQKVPLPEKDRIPLLINGNGDLIWVAGRRQDNRYKVKSTTKKVVIFELKLR